MNATKAILFCAAACAVAGATAQAAGTNETAAAASTNDAARSIAAAATAPTNAAAAFSIPKSLVLRMYEAADAVRDRALAGPDGKPPFNDMLEFGGLCAGGDADLAFAAKDRPRGEMSLVDDGNADRERRELWPFDVEGFEGGLEARMVRGEDGGFRRREEDGTELPVNPTIRWANAEIAAWAVRELDGRYPRMSAAAWLAMTGTASMPEGTAAWRLDPIYYFVLETGEGAWNPRTYSFVLWKGTGSPLLTASFDSFPNDREATAALCLHCDAASANNLAVLEWRHQSMRDSMDPGRIRQFLELARSAGVPTAEANLGILRAHLPEVFAQPNPPDAAETAANTNAIPNHR